MSKPYVVAVYLADRAYGGPEEGGWWFETGELCRIVRVEKNEDKAYDYSRRLNERLKSRQWGPNQGRREISSVLSEGEYQASVWEDTPPAFYPERKPHYE